MELGEAVRRRRSVRSFEARAVDPEVLDRILAASLRAPSAGNTGGTAWVVLEGPGETRRYWDAATTPDWRARAARWPGLERAPVVLLSLTSPGAYVARYGEPDKAASGLGGGEAAWPVPYWWGDAAFAVMSVLLAATDEGLGACFLGTFRGEAGVLRATGVPEGWRLFGAVALGHPDGGDPPSRSLARPAPGWDARVHRGRWSQPASWHGVAP